MLAGQRTVLVLQTERKVPDVEDFKEVAKNSVTSRANTKRVTKKHEPLV